MGPLLKKFFKFTAGMMVFVFGFNMVYMPVTYAQVAFLPVAGSMVNMTPKFDPMVVKGIKFYPDNPFKFNFIVDTGDMPLSRQQIKDEGEKLAAYFLASLTTPEKEMWVNLSPYEKSRVIPLSFGDTEMGKELLSEDYMLKQIMATALYPERQLGREFWQRVYAQALSEFGTTDVPISTFNKVWIVPNEAVVYENAELNSVFVVQSSLKVMLEEDYLALNKNTPTRGHVQDRTTKNVSPSTLPSEPALDVKAAQGNNQPTNALGSQIIREIVIPELTKEVNEGKNFAGLRQVYQSLILATWYKKNLKDNVLAQGYVNRGKTLGVEPQDKQITEKIYQQYLKAYRKGVYNFIKEEVDPATQQMIPRKYFSGGILIGGILDNALVSVSAGDQRVARSETIISKLIRQKRLLLIGIVALLAGAFVGLSSPTSAEAKTSLQDQLRVSMELNTTFDGKLIDSIPRLEEASSHLGPSHQLKFKVNGNDYTYTIQGNEPSIGPILSKMQNKISNGGSTTKGSPSAINAPVTSEVSVPATTPGTVGLTPQPASVAPASSITGEDNLPTTYPTGPAIDLFSSSQKASSGVLQEFQKAFAEGDWKVANKLEKQLSVGMNAQAANPPTPSTSGSPSGPPPKAVYSLKTFGETLGRSGLEVFDYFKELLDEHLRKREGYVQKERPNFEGRIYVGYAVRPEKVAQVFPSYNKKQGLTKEEAKVVSIRVLGKDYDDVAKKHPWIKDKELPVPYKKVIALMNYIVGPGWMEPTSGRKYFPKLAYALRTQNPQGVIKGISGLSGKDQKYIISLMKGEIAKERLPPTQFGTASRGDHAMLSPGGIDLEKLILNTKGDTGVRTAFSDPRILQMLLDAKGLSPQVQSIEPVTESMVNMLLGFNTMQAKDK